MGELAVKNHLMKRVCEIKWVLLNPGGSWSNVFTRGSNPCAPGEMPGGLGANLYGTAATAYDDFQGASIDCWVLGFRVEVFGFKV